MGSSIKNRANAAADAAARQAPEQSLDVVATCPAQRQAVFQKFGVTIGTYGELKRKFVGNGYQREHFIPNSCFMAGPGRTGKTVPGAENYTEDQAITYFVYDNQTTGTEHKFLTDAERAFAKKLEAQGKQASLEEWLDQMEGVTAEMFAAQQIAIAPGETGPWFSPEDANLVARCIRKEYEAQMEKLGISLDTALRNGLAGGAP